MSTGPEIGSAPIGVRTNGRRPTAPVGPGTGERPRRAPGVGLAPELPEGALDGGGGGSASPPRPMMFAALAMAVLSIALAAGARLTGTGHQAVPATPIELVRDVRFTDAPDGTVHVLASAVGGAGEREVAVLRPGELMFVRSTVRALARGRRLEGRALPSDPFRLTRYQNGRLTLDDPVTGAHLELASFGPTNQAAFAQLLDSAR